jgi:hypothetical protein
MSSYEKWRHKQIIMGIVLLGVASEFVFRQFARRALGMTPGELAVGVTGGKLLANVVAHNILETDEQMEDWYYAESEIYSWGGLENIGYGQLLNVIPNPYGVAKILFESGMLIGEATLGPGEWAEPYQTGYYGPAYLYMRRDPKNMRV